MKKAKGSQVLLAKDFRSLKKTPRSEFFQVYGLVRDNIQEWEIYVIGPPATIYEGGVYKAIMKFPDEYPMKPPSLQFLVEMLHPNIYRDGKVCISTLQVGPSGSDSGQYWRPVLGIEQAILSVVSLLSDPNTDDPANTTAANLYKNDRNNFIKQCKIFATRSLASVPHDFEYPDRKSLEKLAKEEVKKESVHEKVVDVKLDNVEGGDDFTYDPEDLSEGGYDLESRLTRMTLESKKSKRKHSSASCNDEQHEVVHEDKHDNSGNNGNNDPSFNPPSKGFSSQTNASSSQASKQQRSGENSMQDEEIVFCDDDFTYFSDVSKMLQKASTGQAHAGYEDGIYEEIDAEIKALGQPIPKNSYAENGHANENFDFFSQLSNTLEDVEKLKEKTNKNKFKKSAFEELLGHSSENLKNSKGQKSSFKHKAEYLFGSFPNNNLPLHEKRSDFSGLNLTRMFSK